MKKRIYIILILILIATISNAQFSYQKLVEKGKIKKAITKAQKKYKSNINDISTLYDLAILYILLNNDSTKNLTYNKQKYNANKAYYYSQKALKAYSRIKGKSLNKLTKKGIDKNALISLNNDVCNELLRVLKIKNSIIAYKQFIKKYKNCPDAIKKANKLIIALEFNTAKNKNTVEAYQEFINKYPNTIEAKNAIYKIDSIKQRKIFIENRRLHKYAVIYDKVVNHTIDTVIINNYMHYTSFIKPKWITRNEYNNLENNLIEKIHDSKDSMINKYAYYLNIPTDITYFELPKYTRIIDSLLYGSNMPKNIEFYDLKKDLYNMQLYAQKYKSKNWDFPIFYKEIQELMLTYWGDSLIDTSDNKQSEWLKSQLEINEFIYGVDNKDSVNLFLQKMLKQRLKVSFYFALSEYGIYLSGQIPFINTNLQTKHLEQQLITVRKQKNKAKTAIIEKQLINELAKVLNLFYIRQKKILPSDEYTPAIEQTAPTYIINKSVPAYGGFVIIEQYYLNKWGIDYENMFIEGILNGHVITRVKTADNKAYVIDILWHKDTVSQEISLKYVDKQMELSIKQGSYVGNLVNNKLCIPLLIINNMHNSLESASIKRINNIDIEKISIYSKYAPAWYRLAKSNQTNYDGLKAINIATYLKPANYVYWEQKSHIAFNLNKIELYKESEKKSEEIKMKNYFNDLLKNGEPNKINKNNILKYINLARKKGCYCADKYMPPAPPVKWNNELEKVAYSHTLDINYRKVKLSKNPQEIGLAHIGKDGSDVMDRVLRTKYFDGDYNAKFTGEIISLGARNVKEAVDGWLSSPKHCRILMMANFKHMGAAHVGNYWTVVFGGKIKF